MKRSTKDRLYIALYARGGESLMPGGEDKYHWALLAGPKNENAHSKGKRFHIKEIIESINGRTQTRWIFEERDIAMNPTAMILVRIAIGKVMNLERAMAVLRDVPIRGNQFGWNCVWWVKEALGLLREEGKTLSRTSATDWTWVRNASMGYVRRKEKEHRFDRDAPLGMFDMSRVATYDLLKTREIIP
ncbi:hypothetical protein SLS53_007231 [Cytospora paraplurivora]|uniref:Uncharacterized protein n=1 Tax=Cytospora paraplurivora TaxID=2898453 RepID=A0AAN9YE22_9PEZI